MANGFNFEYYVSSVVRPTIQISRYSDGDFKIFVRLGYGVTNGDADLDPTIYQKQAVTSHDNFKLYTKKILIKNFYKESYNQYSNGSSFIWSKSGQSTLFPEIITPSLIIGTGNNFTDGAVYGNFSSLGFYAQYIQLPTYLSIAPIDIIMDTPEIDDNIDIATTFDLSGLYLQSTFVRTQAGIYPATAFNLISFRSEFTIIGRVIK